MEVHIFLYHWCTAEEEGTDVMGVYHDLDRACIDMRKWMRVKRADLEEYYDGKFDSDFEMDEKTYVSFGFYGEGNGMDHSWSGRIETAVVQ